MNALVLLAVLGTGQVAATEKPATEKWLDDYGSALKQAQKEGRPLLIVIDRPGDAVGRVSQISHRETKPADDLRNYVLCRVDADTSYGKAVAQAFGATTLPHTAVIDKAGQYVLYTKQGQFTSEEWTSTLDTYRTGAQPVSYRAAAQEAVFGSSYGSYCPSCQRGR